MSGPSDHIMATGLPDGLTQQQLVEAFSAYGKVKWSKLFSEGKKGIIQFATIEEAEFLVSNLSGSSLHELLPDPVTMVFHHPKNWTDKPKGDGPYGGFLGGGKGGGKGEGGKWGMPFGGGGWGGKGPGMMGMGGPADIDQLKKGLFAAGILPGGKGSNIEQTELYICGLPPNTNDLDLYELFAPFGAIPPRGVRALRNKDDASVCSGVGFVNFLTREHAEASIQTLNGTMLGDGSSLRVSIKRSRPREAKGQEKGGSSD